MARYIDADELWDTLFTALKDAVNNAEDCMLHETNLAPVIHAHWEKHFKRPGVYEDLYWHCTNCNSRTLEEYAPYWWLYCPHCGAKMDEVINDG